MNHCQFKQFLNDMDSENGEVLYCSEFAGWVEGECLNMCTI
jgi:hypothetical protein